MYSYDDDDEWILNRIWESDQNWYKPVGVTLRKKWSADFRDKDLRLTLLQANESSLKYTVDMLNKRETLNHLIINTY